MSRGVVPRGIQEKVQGFMPSLVGDQIPQHLKVRALREESRELLLLNELSQAKLEYRLANGHEMPPSVLRHAIEEIAYRDVYGVAPIDLVAGEMLGGPNRGRKIKGYGGQLMNDGRLLLCAELEDANNKSLFVGNDRPSEETKQRYALSAGVDTKQGNTATDRALIYSWWDTGLYGGTAYLFAPPVLEQMLTVRSRKVGWMRPFLNMGIAPSLSYQIKTRTNNALRQLFTSASSYSVLETTVLPRKEGRTGSVYLRPKYGSADLGVRGYMLHSDISAEAMSSIEARRVGAWESAMSDLMEGLGLIDEYDQVLALFYGLTTGYSRQRKASDDSWNVATLEVPRGKAEFIGVNFQQHALFYQYKSNVILDPVSHASDFFKVASASAFDYAGMFAAAGNQIIELIAALKIKQEKKNRGLDIVSLPFEMAVKYGMDSRLADKTKVYSDIPNPRFANEPNFIGTIRHPLVGEVQVFGQPIGSTPSDLTTTDSKAITGLVVAGEEGLAVSDHVFYPSSILITDGMEVVSVDTGGASVSVVQPNMKKVASAFSAGGIQPIDLQSVSVAYTLAE